MSKLLNCSQFSYSTSILANISTLWEWFVHSHGSANLKLAPKQKRMNLKIKLIRTIKSLEWNTELTINNYIKKKSYEICTLILNQPYVNSNSKFKPFCGQRLQICIEFTLLNHKISNLEQWIKEIIRTCGHRNIS